jgi:hypothetical protein
MNSRLQMIAIAVTIGLLLARGQVASLIRDRASGGSRALGGDWCDLCVACMPALVSLLG